MDLPPLRRRTGFCGFQAQVQPGVMRTVQEIIEDALNRTTGETKLVRLRFSSRTDTGVHARGQVVVLASRCAELYRIFCDALNTRLPQDVVCRSVVTMTEAQANFDPCVDATRKRYEYELITGGLRPVLHCRNVWHVRKLLDVAKMQLAVNYMMTPPHPRKRQMENKAMFVQCLLSSFMLKRWTKEEVFNTKRTWLRGYD